MELGSSGSESPVQVVTMPLNVDSSDIAAIVAVLSFCFSVFVWWHKQKKKKNNARKGGGDNSALSVFLLCGMLLGGLANPPIAFADECPLCEPARAGDLAEVKRLIDGGANPNAAGDWNRPLIWAAWRGHDEVVKMLLAAGANPNAADGDGNTALIRAPQSARGEHDEIIKMLLAAGANPNAEDDIFGRTALDWAQAQGFTKIISILENYTPGQYDHLVQEYESGESSQNGQGEENDDVYPNDDLPHSIVQAGEHGDIEKIKRLLAEGANPNSAIDGGKTALHVAASNGHAEALKILLAAGADVNSANARESTALHYAASNGHDEALKILLAAGADVNSANVPEMTALHYVASKGHAEALKILLAAGADVNAENRLGRTALALAKVNEHPEIVALIERGADPESERTPDEKLPVAKEKKPCLLCVAAKNGNLVMIETLLASGHNPLQIDEEGYDPFYYAVVANNTNILELLENAKRKRQDEEKRRQQIKQAEEEAEQQRAEEEERARKERERQRAEEEERRRQAEEEERRRQAEEEERRRQAEELAQLKAEKEQREREETEERRQAEAAEAAYQIAIDGGGLRDYVAFLDGDYDNRQYDDDVRDKIKELVSARHKRGRTALHNAARGQNLEEVRLLLDNGADPNAQDKRGVTPLMFATHNDSVKFSGILDRVEESLGGVENSGRQRQMKILSLLLDAGANPNIKDRYGKSALSRALRVVNTDAARILRKYGAK